MILHDGAGGGKAIINGTPLKVGEKQGEWLLERIESNRVRPAGAKGNNMGFTGLKTGYSVDTAVCRCFLSMLMLSLLLAGCANSPPGGAAAGFGTAACRACQNGGAVCAE